MDLTGSDSSKQNEFVKSLEQMIENLEKHGQLSNDQVKGLFKTFLMVQIENTKFVDELSTKLNEVIREISKLQPKS